MYKLLPALVYYCTYFLWTSNQFFFPQIKRIFLLTDEELRTDALLFTQLILFLCLVVTSHWYVVMGWRLNLSIDYFNLARGTAGCNDMSIITSLYCSTIIKHAQSWLIKIFTTWITGPGMQGNCIFNATILRNHSPISWKLSNWSPSRFLELGQIKHNTQKNWKF